MSTRETAARAHEHETPSGRLPNLVIIGVGRAGTTSLFNYLGRHPDVGTSDIKELRYFNPLRHGQELGPIEEYARHFKDCAGKRYAVEATPGYFYGGRTLATGMIDTLPDVRALLSLRAPEERCWSWFRFVKSRLRIPKEMTFEEYLDRCEALHATGADAEPESAAYWGLGAGCYAKWLPDWLDVMGDRLHVLFLEGLSSDPRGTMSGVCRWLDIATVFDDFEFRVENQAVQYRNGRIQKVAVAVNRRGEAMFRRHAALKRRLKRVYQGANGSRGESGMAPEARQRLEDFYRPHTAALVRQLADIGKTVPASWSA